MKKREPKLSELIELIYDKHPKLLPFLDIFRKDINSLQFVPLGEDATAAIVLRNKKFDIVFNTEYIKREKLSDEDILWVLCHEISHYILGHLVSEYEKKYPPMFRNFGYDCQVNSMLYNINERKRIKVFDPNLEAYGEFLRGAENELYFLLAPPHLSEKEVREDFEKVKNIDAEKLELIKEFWLKNYRPNGLGLDEIFYYLEKILPPEETKSETSEDEFEHQDEAFDEEDLPESVRDFFDKLNEAPAPPLPEEILEGFGDAFEIEFNINDAELNRRKLNILRNAMREVLFYDGRGAVRELDFSRQRTVMPNVTRRETLMLGYDILPSFYENTMLSEIGKTLAVYVDFSASTFEYHAEVSKLIASLEEFKSARFFAFTENVYEIDYKDFFRGKFISGGTDIEPVYEHINKNGFEKALIITDGEFSTPQLFTNAKVFILLLGEFPNAGNFGIIPEKVWKLK